MTLQENPYLVGSYRPVAAEPRRGGLLGRVLA